MKRFSPYQQHWMHSSILMQDHWLFFFRVDVTSLARFRNSLQYSTVPAFFLFFFFFVRMYVCMYVLFWRMEPFLFVRLIYSIRFDSIRFDSFILRSVSSPHDGRFFLAMMFLCLIVSALEIIVNGRHASLWHAHDKYWCWQLTGAC